MKYKSGDIEEGSQVRNHVNNNRIKMKAIFFFEDKSRIAERTDIKINEWPHGHDDDHGNEIGKKDKQGCMTIPCCPGHIQIQASQRHKKNQYGQHAVALP